jgi:hypothetical protein
MKVKKQARADAFTLTTVTIPLSAKRAIAAQEGRIEIDVRFYPPDARHRDDDNAIASFKAARDGIADALGVDDRRFRPTYYFMDPAKPGKIEVVIHRHATEQAQNASEGGSSAVEKETARTGSYDPRPSLNINANVERDV